MKLRFNILLLFIFCFLELLSQEDITSYRDIYTLPSQDTILAKRLRSEWWYGAFAGANFNFYFNDLLMPKDPFRELDSLKNNTLVEFPNSFGDGMFFGLTGEWLPYDSKWGAMLKIFLYDNRVSISKSAVYSEIVNKKEVFPRYVSTIDFTYLTISPSARYNLPLFGLHAFGGLDFEFMTASENKYRREYDSPAMSDTGTGYQGSNIDHDRILSNANPLGFRLGLHAGIGYEFFVADLNHKTRVYLIPFISLHGGTNIYNGFGSSRNTILVRAGLSLRMGPDRVERDTIKFNPYYVAPVQYIASARFETGISYEVPSMPIDIASLSSDLVLEPILIMQQSTKKLAQSEVAEKKEDITPLFDETVPSTVSIAENIDFEEVEEVIPTKKKPKLENTKIYNYASAQATGLNQEMKDYLDRVADWLKENPNARVQIVGHSDALGTVPENEQRSEKRTMTAVNYLLREKKIPRNRVLYRSAGARENIAPNDTEANRRKNRRIEILRIE